MTILEQATRRLAAEVVTISALAATGGMALLGDVVEAHTPPDFGYQWTCSGGEGHNSYAGICYRYLPGAAATWHFEGPGFTGQNYSDVRAAAGLWDQTNGHQFNYTEDAYPGDGWQGFPVYSVSQEICNSPSAVGCTSTGVNGTQLYVSQMKFRNPSNWKNVAGHEFGHALGLGHSSLSTALMWRTSNGVTSLTDAEKQGRCQVYGHALGLWGGCTCPK